LRAAVALFTLLVVGALVGGSPASAASAASGCPTQTFLNFGHLGYIATVIAPTVQIRPGSRVGSGTIDEPMSANGCRRNQKSVEVEEAGSIDPRVAVLVSGRPRTLFVIGHRCDGFAGSSYWNCLLRPLVFNRQQFTGTSYPGAPAPRRTVPLGATIGTAMYGGRKVAVHRIQGVAPSLAVAISGQPSAAFLSPRTCPYSGFSNNPRYDNLLRCLRSPVWFTFDPPGSPVGGTVVARSDRPLSAAVAGASISLVPLPVEADLVPSQHGSAVPVGQVADQVSLRIPDVPAGLYEAVVSCRRCGSTPGGGSGGLDPAGSILVTSKPKSSLGIQIISYALPVALVAAAFLALRNYRRRRLQTGATGSGAARSPRR
jgi:hypothetical protein